MTPPNTEHIEDFTTHEWCNKLLSDPTITHIAKRHIPDAREDVSNTFFTRTLFTDEAIRAFLHLYRPGKGQRRHVDEDNIFSGNALLHMGMGAAQAAQAAQEAQRQALKEDKSYDPNDSDVPEALILVSIGQDLDGGVRRLHGGVTAALLDQVLGTLLSYNYENTSATAELNVKYKKAITTPCILLCKAKVVREKGRWIETAGSVEDGTGTVFAEGRGSFVLNRVGAPAKI